MSEDNNLSSHRPVLLGEVLQYLSVECGEVEAPLLLDCTVGGGGHSEALLKENERLLLIGLDCDRAAVERSQARLARFAGRCCLIKGNFYEVATVLQEHRKKIESDLLRKFSPDLRFSYILADLGYSSDQLEDAARGLSFQEEGPLDMRFDQESVLTANEIVNNYGYSDLRKVFVDGGVAQDSARLANAVIEHRPIETTRELAEICESAVPRRPRRKRSGESVFPRASSKHPATLAFQAIRIAVNNELEGLQSFLETALSLLTPGGRLAVIGFHSLEDRIVTRAMRRWTQSDEPRDLPIREGYSTKGRLLTKKAVCPSDREKSLNPRARSARMRVFERATVA